MLQRFLPLWLLILCGLALLPPFSFGPDPFVALSDAIPQFNQLLIALVMFCIGTLLPKDEIDQLRHRWKLVLLGSAAQYTLMPALALAAVFACDLSTETKLGILIAGTVPGAMASNVLTLQARGNVSYSISLTATTTLLSPVVVPILLAFCMGRVTSTDEFDLQRFFNPATVGLSLLLTVALPVVFGHLCARMFPAIERLAARFSEIVANVAILWLIASIVARNREYFRAGVEFQLLAGLVTLNIAGYVLGSGTARLFRLDEPMRRALTLEVGMQNAGLGAVLASQIFGRESEAVVPPVLYMFGCMLTGAMLAAYWRVRPVESETISDARVESAA